MYEVWDNDMFLFTCDADDVDSFETQGFRVVKC